MTGPADWIASPEALLADHAWARRLAQTLVRDAALAEDFAQEACVRALDHPPGADLRRWLAGIVRNLVRQHRRESVRRARREELAAAAEVLPSAADAIERLTVERSVVRAVLELDEPYRSVIVLRFYDDLPPRRIAAELAIPVATVKTRLARGLARLRAELAREHGGDRALALFLLPLSGRNPLPAPFLAGALTVNAILKLGVAALVLIGLVLWSTSRPGLEVSDALEADGGAGVALRAPEASATPVGAAAPREALPLEAPEERPAIDEPARPMLAGRVVDVFGAPVAGVALGLRETGGVVIEAEGSSVAWSGAFPVGPPAAVSGADGRFALERQTSRALVAQDERWEAVFAPSGQREEETIVVVAPRFRLAGRVVDEQGDPLAGVALSFRVPDELRHAIAASLEDSRDGHWSATSDEAGRFELPRLPSVAGAFLWARRESFEPRGIGREAWSEDVLEIVLARPGGAWLEGVVEHDGEPVAGASVLLGYRATTSDERGGFRLSLAGIEGALEVVGVTAGRLPARYRTEADPEGKARWPDLVRLEVGEESATLAGTVVDARGEPLGGQEVWLDEPTTVWLQGSMPIALESLLAGERTSRHGTKTDEQGRFALRGLERRAYALQVADPRTALVTTAGPFEAGASEVRIVQATDALVPLVRGRVVSARGTPVAGVVVQVEGPMALVGAQGKFYAFTTDGAQARTDAAGAFELHDVPRRDVTVHVYGEHVADPELELAPGFDADDLLVEVDVWAHLRITLSADRAEVTSFATLDVHGEPLMMKAPNGGGSSLLYRQELSGGVSPVINAPEHAATLVLYRGTEELERIPIRLELGRVNEFDL